MALPPFSSVYHGDREKATVDLLTKKRYTENKESVAAGSITAAAGTTKEGSL